MSDNIYAVSKPSRKKLIKELAVLKAVTDLMMEFITEVK